MTTLLIALAALCIGAGITFVVCYFLPKEKVKERNEEIFNEEQKAQQHINELDKEYTNKKLLLQANYDNERLELKSKIQQENNNWEVEKNSKENALLKETQQLQVELSKLQEKKTSTLALIDELKNQAQTAADTFKAQTIELAAQDVEKATTEMWNRYEENKINFQSEYNKIVQDTITRFQNEVQRLDGIIAEKKEQIQELASKVNAATEANKRAELERNKKDFYRLILSDEDKEEIKKIRSIIPYLRSAEPINKVIWKVYYEKPTTDMIGRVIGPNKHTGIYKITNIDNGMCYVGQAVNIGR